MHVPTLDGDAPTAEAVAKCLEEALPFVEQHPESTIGSFDAAVARLGKGPDDSDHAYSDAGMTDGMKRKRSDSVGRGHPTDAANGTSNDGSGLESDTTPDHPIRNRRASSSLADDSHPVLVHCRCGMGRSATVATSILLWMHACEHFGIALPRAASSAFVSSRYLESAKWLRKAGKAKIGATNGSAEPARSGGPPIGAFWGSARREGVLRQIRKETKRVVATIRSARPEVVASVVSFSAIRALEHYIADILLAS